MSEPEPAPSAQNDPVTRSVITRTGRYQILEELGQGGMGIVYKAHDPILNRFVALKVLRFFPGARTEELEQRFRREAQAVGRLNHPNIVLVYDAGMAEGQWYLVMEYLAEMTLDRFIRQAGAQPLARVAGMVTQMCEALEYAHARQIIHRDIEPSNIMLVENDRVKVTDFGLASLASEFSLTQTEGLVGMLPYMSPEQIKSASGVDGRSDLFSLGAVVYELLTGKLLFPGQHITPMYLIISPNPVDLSDASLPDPVRRVLEKALAKDVGERFSTCAEFSAAFTRVVVGRIAQTSVPVQARVSDIAGKDEREILEQGRYTLTYRAAEARQVMGWIKAGQSGCLTGLRGAGKSNFLRFLLGQAARQHYQGQDWADFIFVLMDLLALTERTEWAVFELILDRPMAQLGPTGVDPEIVKEVESLHRDVVHARDPLTARRVVERCVTDLCRRPGRHVVLLFDEFDAVFPALDPSLFRCLRAVRDAHKDQVSYIVIAANDLTCQRDDLPEVEHFCRLVSRNVCGLGPYGEADARQMIRHLTARRSVELSEGDTTRLIELCGGHAGLLKASLSLLEDAQLATSLGEIASALGDEPAIQTECKKNVGWPCGE